MNGAPIERRQVRSRRPLKPVPVHAPSHAARPALARFAWPAVAALAFAGAFVAHALQGDPAPAVAPLERAAVGTAPAPPELRKVAALPAPPPPERRRPARRRPRPAPAAAPAPIAPAPAAEPEPAAVPPVVTAAPPPPAPAPPPPPRRRTFDSKG
jgi:hypothetical protein